MKKKMKKVIPACLCSLLLASCTQQKEIERVKVQLEIINPDLETAFPGQLIAGKQCLILCDPLVTSEYIKVLNKQTGEKIFGLLDIGQGPDEFNMPVCDVSTNNLLTIFDLNVQKKLEYHTDSLAQGKVTTVHPARFPFTNIVALARFKPNQYVAGIFTASMPFAIMKEDVLVSGFGKYPLDADITNRYDVFQGTILYNEGREVLGYATFDSPYLSLYKYEAGAFHLLWESRFADTNYSIHNHELKYADNQPAGIGGVAFTKDYIVCLVKEMKLKDSTSRSKEQMAKTIYIYDYDGELLRIAELDIPTTRISATPDSNAIYFISLDEEYCLTKLDLQRYNM